MTDSELESAGFDAVVHKPLARIFHELPAATMDMTVLPGVLGYRTLRRTVQVRLGSNPLRLPGGTAISSVSPHQFVKYPGLNSRSSPTALPVFTRNSG
jgi:hypothetical protein